MNKAMRMTLWICLLLLTCSLILAACNTGSHSDSTEFETDAPEAGTSETDAPATETSATDAPATDAPTTDAPTTDEQATSEPETEAHAHAFGEWLTITEATCSTEGLLERACACGEKETQTVDTTAHTEVIDAGTAATCLVAGITEGKHCDVCDEILVAQTVIEATGHTFVDDVCHCGRNRYDTLVSCEQWVNNLTFEGFDSFTLDYVEINQGPYTSQFTGNIQYGNGVAYGDFRNDHPQNAYHTAYYQEEALHSWYDIYWFTNNSISIAEILDDYYFAMEDYGYNEFTYSEQTESYIYQATITFEEEEMVLDTAAEIWFEYGKIKEIHVEWIEKEKSESGESEQTAVYDMTARFSNINSTVPDVPVAINEIESYIQSRRETVFLAAACTSAFGRGEEPEVIDHSTLAEIIGSITVSEVRKVELTDGKISCIDISGNIKLIHSTWFEHENSYAKILLDESGQIVGIESDPVYYYMEY